MTPVFAHGHLRLYLLNLLAERPMHGYEVMQELENRFGGTYTPSAGTIYPRLSKLQADGLISNESDGRKTVYTITDAGRAELADRASELTNIEDSVTGTVRHLADRVRADVNDAMKSLRADLAASAREGKAETRARKRSESKGSGPAGRREMQEAELVLGEFRHQMRTELRLLVARDALAPGTAADLKRRLDEVRAQLGEVR